MFTNSYVLGIHPKFDSGYFAITIWGGIFWRGKMNFYHFAPMLYGKVKNTYYGNKYYCYHSKYEDIISISFQEFFQLDNLHFR